MIRLLANSRRHDIAFHIDGRIEISARVTRALSIRQGDAIDIAVDDRTREVYLYAKHIEQNAGRYKAQCFCTSRGKVRNSMRAYSVELCRRVIGMRNKGENCARLPVGEPVNIDGIGTAMPLIIRYRL